MEIYLDIDDLKEIEKNYEKLAKWLTSNFSSFPACAFILQTIMEAIDKSKEDLNNQQEKIDNE